MTKRITYCECDTTKLDLTRKVELWRCPKCPVIIPGNKGERVKAHQQLHKETT